MPNTITEKQLVEMLSTLTVDQVSAIIVSATLKDRFLPVRACASLINLISTCAMLMIPTDRAAIVNRMRDVADLIEHEMVEFPDEGSGTH